MKKILIFCLAAVLGINFSVYGATGLEISRQIIKKNKKLFFKEGLKNLKDVGTVFQTDVADKIIGMFERLRVLQQGKAHLKIVEVGAGAGEVTLQFIEHICKKKYKNISIDAIELREEYCEALKNGCEALKKHYGDDYPDVNIYNENFLTWKPHFKTYDYLVSTIPFNGFSYKMVEQFLEKYKNLIPFGMLSYVEYMVFGHFKRFWAYIKKIFSCCSKSRCAKEYENLKKIKELLENFRKNNFCLDEKKYKHLPPIHIYHLIMT